jgi:hypothetical protein
VVYVGALFVYAAGTLGWFGVAQDPLSGIFLFLLGLPWVLFHSPGTGVPWFAIAAPLINVAIVYLLCRWRI